MKLLNSLTHHFNKVYIFAITFNINKIYCVDNVSVEGVKVLLNFISERLSLSNSNNFTENVVDNIRGVSPPIIHKAKFISEN